jgi:polyphosphate:AMP phosphotransferase
MLSDEGTVLLKLWFHLSKKAQKKRLERLSKDAHESWRVTDLDWDHLKLYDEFRTVSTRALRHTSTDNAPWRIVAGREPRFRHLTVGRAVLDALRDAVKPHQAPEPEGADPSSLRPVDGRLVLDEVDLTRQVPKEKYEPKLVKLQRKLNLLTRTRSFSKRSLLVLFEGWDAAGKGGAIRRVTAALDARIYNVVPVAAPTDEEKAQPYLWRFWRQVPRWKHVTILDRSWYGRVLVERVEGFAHSRDWRRAYVEINDFEEQLVEHGVVLVKFFLHIDADEQLRRFEERQRTGFKRYKITQEDWRNRERWADYALATSEMLERTSTEIAPWTVVAANDKRHARIEVLRTIAKTLERQIGA